MQSVASLTHQVTADHQERRGTLNETMDRVLNRLFGCWQHELSRPFSNNGRTYRICVKCGMSRDFDPASWKTHGTYRMTGPNVIYPKLRTTARHAQVESHQCELRDESLPESLYTANANQPPQRFSSLESLRQGPLGTSCNAGAAA